MILSIMKKNAIRLIISFLFMTWCGAVQASPIRLSLGASIIRADINDPKYKYLNQNETTPSFNIGLTKSFDPFIITVQTNRLFNTSVTRSITNSGLTFQSKTKITSDTVLIGYRYNRLVPSLLISNTKVDKYLFYKGQLQGNQTNYAILYGVNFGYLINKNINFNLFLIAPNKELYLKSAIGTGINFIF